MIEKLKELQNKKVVEVNNLGDPKLNMFKYNALVREVTAIGIVISILEKAENNTGS